MMRNSVSRILAASIFLGPLLGLSPALADGLLDKAREQGSITFGFTNEVPYSYSEQGELTGADAVVAKHILAEMGIPHVEGVLTEFQSLIPALQAGRFDVNGGMYITPARCSQVIFSNPLWAAADSLIVLTGNPKAITSYQVLADNADLKVGYIAGGVTKETLVKSGVAEDQIVPFPDTSSAIAAIKAGRVDAFAATAVGNQRLLDEAKDPKLERAKFTPPVFDGKPAWGYGGFSFRQEDSGFAEEFNERLVKFLGTPEHLALVRPFGITEEDVTPAVGKTAEALCKE